MSDFSQFFDADFGIDYGAGQSGMSLFDADVGDPLFDSAWAKKDEEFDALAPVPAPPAAPTAPRAPGPPPQQQQPQQQPPRPQQTPQMQQQMLQVPPVPQQQPQTQQPVPQQHQQHQQQHQQPPPPPQQQAQQQRRNRKPGRIQIPRQSMGTPQPQAQQQQQQQVPQPQPQPPQPPSQPQKMYQSPMMSTPSAQKIQQPPPQVPQALPPQAQIPQIPSNGPSAVPTPTSAGPQQYRNMPMQARQGQSVSPPPPPPGIQNQQTYQQFMRQQQQQQAQGGPQNQWRRASVGQPPVRAENSHTPLMSPAQVQQQLPMQQQQGQQHPPPAHPQGGAGPGAGASGPGAQQWYARNNKPPQAQQESIKLSLIGLLYYMSALKAQHSQEVQNLLSKIDQMHMEQVMGLFNQLIVKVPDTAPFSARIPPTEIPQDKFQRVVADFMQHRGTPVFSSPTVAGKRFNLYVIFMAVQSLGSFLGVARGFKWQQLAQQLQIPFTSEIVRELIQTYVRLLLPYEEAFNSNAQVRTMLLDKNAMPAPTQAQIQAQQKARAQAQAQAQAQARSQTHPQMPPQHQQMPPQQPPQPPVAHVPQQPPQPPQGHHQQHTLQQQQHQQPDRVARPPLSQEHMKRMYPGPEQGPNKRIGVDPTGKDRSPAPVPSAAAGGAATTTAGAPAQNNTLKNTFKLQCEDDKYLLQRRHLNTYGGHDMRNIIHLGSEIENWRPYVAFPLDLGTVDLHAITMSLASRYPADVRQALDKLVVVTADPRVHISLQHCPHLFANLSKVVEDVLNIILEDGPDNIRRLHNCIATEPVDAKQSSTLGDFIFDKVTANAPKQKQKDLIIEVDSNTGAEIETTEHYHTEEVIDAAAIEQLKAQQKKDAEDLSIKEEAFVRKLEGKPTIVDMETKIKNAKEMEKRIDEPFSFIPYIRRYALVEEEFSALKEPEDEKITFFRTAACNRLLAGTCVIRNLSFAEANKPLIAKKPQFQKLLWKILFSLAENNCLLDSHLRTLDLSKDLLVCLSNISLHLVLDDPKNALVLVLFLLSFSVQETPFDKDGEIEFIECDTEVHRYLSNAIDIFAKVVPRDRNHMNLIESVLKDTITDPDYRVLVKRYLGPRTKLEPCEFLTRMFAMVISVLPYPHIKLSLDPRGQIIWQASLGCEMIVDMIPDDDDQPDDAPTPWKGYNVAQKWLNSKDKFGVRVLRTIKFMGMVVVPASQNESTDGKAEKTRPFAPITQRGVELMRKIYTLAAKSKDFSNVGIIPTIEQVLGGLFATEMEKSVVRYLEYLYLLSQNEDTKPKELL